MGQILDGKKMALRLEEVMQQEIALLSRRPPCLAVFLVGDHVASQVYVRNKTRACKRVGILSRQTDLPSSVTESELLHRIDEANNDPTVDGILVQMPLPTSIVPESVIMRIAPEKDVDGFHPINMGKLLLEQSGGFISCTPLGIQTLLSSYDIDLRGKHVVILGRSSIVGKPLAALFLQKTKNANATVTIVHSQTPDPKPFCRQADILIAAIGVPRFVRGDDIKEGAVVVDVGISQQPDPSDPRGYHLIGDVDFASVEKRCRAITPVPGGVGPMTIAMLLQNTLSSYRQRQKP